jgi:hypothetical protein
MGEVSLRHHGDINAPYFYASAVHLVNARNQVEKCAFSGTGWTHQGKKLPVGDLKAYVVEDGYNKVASMV